MGETEKVWVLLAGVDPVLEEGDPAVVRRGAPVPSGRFLSSGMESGDDDRLRAV